ncbi:MAG: hypothetical protein A2021_02490 [Elusimicrobia bacterium GWF2_52_66]|nr:MAG: hypothetical protein A2X33_04295 [Elusimicrobia bacterium GWA2_51_34]OGR84620.1 MAG: hypothetical protein A2021_02490 [Elusimicrobia bacterium GWF2_52_66]HAF95935.1 hypothetical protein [Elusimicrobiota bacterium]HCE97549.1 hypothetical protein [Elusimicrobiota bacterium]
MRWSYIIPRFTLLALVWAFFYFAFDPILKWAMIKGLEKGAKAKVEIADVKTSFLPPALRISALAVADSKEEYKNLCEFSALDLKIEGRPLLEKKFIIDKASLSGLKFGTVRKTSGKLFLAKEETPEFVKELGDSSKNFALDRAADIKTDAISSYKVDPDSLESVKLAKELEQKYNEDYKALSAKADFQKYQARMDALKADYEKAKGESNPLKKAGDYAKAGKELKKLSEDFKKDRAEIEKTLADAKNSIKAIEEARRRDTSSVMAKLKLPSLDKASLARMLAGPVVAANTEKAWKWLAIARKYMPQSANAKALANEAARGRVVHFPREKTWPSFLIKEMSLSGELGLEEPLDYNGSIEGITTQPKLYGKPLTAEIKGRKGARALYFSARADASGDALKTKTSLKYSGMAVNGFKLGSENSISVDVKGTGAFKGDFTTEGTALRGFAVFNITGASFLPKADAVKAAPVKDALLGAFNSLNSASIEADISGTLTSPKFSVDTDLAKALSAAFSKTLGSEVKKAEEEAAKKVDAALEPYRKKLDSLTSAKETELKEKLGAGEKSIGSFSDGMLKNLKEKAAPGGLKLPKFKL